MIKSENWAVYSYEYGQGQHAFISFDADLAMEKEHSGYPNLNRVILFIPMNLVNAATGIFHNEVAPQVKSIEDSLLENLMKENVDCRYVGKMVYGGMVDFVFQVEDQKKFLKIVKKTMRKKSRFKHELRTDSGWTFFDEKVSPKPVFWQQISDAKMIMELIKAGSNPAETHILQHVIKGSEADLGKFSDHIKSAGLKAETVNDQVIVTVESVLDLDEIFRISGFLFNTSNQFKVRYDGWGAMVEKAGKEV